MERNEAEDIMVLVVNLMNASRAAGFCRGRRLDDAPDNQAEAAAMAKLLKAIDSLTEESI